MLKCITKAVDLGDCKLGAEFMSRPTPQMPKGNRFDPNPPRKGKRRYAFRNGKLVEITDEPRNEILAPFFGSNPDKNWNTPKR